MKKCPVCSSRLFEDMDVCYNCLHHFEGNGGIEDEAGNISETSFNASKERKLSTDGVPLSFDMGDFLMAFRNFLDDYFKRIKCA